MVKKNSIRNAIQWVLFVMSVLLTVSWWLTTSSVIDLSAYYPMIIGKLEKLAKDKSASLSRELDRISTLVGSLGDPDSEIDKLNSQLSKVEEELCARQTILQDLENTNKLLVDKMQIWKRDNMGGLKLWSGIAMIIIGILIFFI